MIAYYGYSDGSGDFFISIDTGKCSQCPDKPCVEKCPQKIIEVFVDDYEDEVVGVKDSERKSIKYTCAPCKTASLEGSLPCLKACSFKAIKHSW